jgi:hypothetical protein
MLNNPDKNQFTVWTIREKLLHNRYNAPGFFLSAMLVLSVAHCYNEPYMNNGNGDRRDLAWTRYGGESLAAGT